MSYKLPRMVMVVFALAMLAPPVRGQAPPGGAPGGGAPPGGAPQGGPGGPGGGPGGGGGGRFGGSIIAPDYSNNSLTISTTPRNHRRIAALIRKVAVGKLAGGKMETRVFNLRSMSPDQLFKILEFEQPTFQRDNTIYFPETSDGTYSAILSVGGAGGAGGGGAPR